MRIMVVSYSLTGNNDGFAASIAAACSGTHARLREPKPRTMGAIALDMIFGRTPKIDILPELDGSFDAVLFVAPVWMGQVASPLRACFRLLRGKIGAYAFISLSGGADGPESNPKIAAELTKRLVKAPLAVIDLHIADLLPQEPKPTRAITSAYRANEDDLRKLTGEAMAALRAVGISA